MLRLHVISAIFKRNFWSYFSGIIGYLFIVVFVMVGGLLAFNEQFFTNNLANLDQLNGRFPQLLLFLVPAITMSVWSEEKKLGTDELLFTLPVSDLEVLIAKYLGVAAVYTVALGFSLAHAVVLQYIGNPDWGLIATTYMGYWLAGCALLSCGMVASYLTNSATVAFVLGAIVCAGPVFIGDLGHLVGLDTLCEGLSIAEQFRPFGMGIVPMGGILYFVSLTLFMLYINLVLIGYRHWSDGNKGQFMSGQFVVRSLSLLAMLISANVVLANVSFKQDMTSEGLYSVTSTTRQLLSEVKDDRPVTIQAFVSRDVPREFVPVKTTLLGLLGQYQQFGGKKITTRVVTIDAFSPEADQAKQAGIEPRKVQSERGGRTQLDDVFLGAVINCGANEVVVPFFDVAIPAEYELTRSVRTVAKEERRVVGILETDAKIGGGFDMSSFRSQPEWRIVSELKKQYTVENVSAASPIDTAKYDVLIAVLPSSLGNNEMTNFVEYVKTGKPVLVFDDPLPATNPGLAPRQPKPKPGGGGPFGGQAPAEPKADGGKATSLVNLLQIQWNFDEVVWDDQVRVLHPEYADIVRPEMVAISQRLKLRPGQKEVRAFSQESAISSGLQEVLLFFAGTIRPRENSKYKFEPLMRTTTESGLISWSKLTRPGFFGGGVEIVDNPPRVLDDVAHVVAAEIKSNPDSEQKINVVYVADTDMIADWFFTVRDKKLYGLDLDNVTFVLNAVDALVGDEAYIPLRKRRAKHRTLVQVERQTSEFIANRSKEQENANTEAEKAMENAKARLKAEVEKVKNDDSLDDLAKMQLIALAQENENRRLLVEEANIEQEKEKKVEAVKIKTEREIRAIEQGYSLRAVLLPPIPAIVLGLIVWFSRMKNEQKDIAPSRRRSSGA
jgi:ABC-2 type transport system permease protein